MQAIYSREYAKYIDFRPRQMRRGHGRRYERKQAAKFAAYLVNIGRIKPSGCAKYLADRSAFFRCAQMDRGAGGWLSSFWVHEHNRSIEWVESFKIMEEIRFDNACRIARRMARAKRQERATATCGRKFWGVFAAASGAAA